MQYYRRHYRDNNPNTSVFNILLGFAVFLCLWNLWTAPSSWNDTQPEDQLQDQQESSSSLSSSSSLASTMSPGIYQMSLTKTIATTTSANTPNDATTSTVHHHPHHPMVNIQTIHGQQQWVPVETIQGHDAILISPYLFQQEQPQSQSSQNSHPHESSSLTTFTTTTTPINQQPILLLGYSTSSSEKGRMDMPLPSIGAATPMMQTNYFTLNDRGHYDANNNINNNNNNNGERRLSSSSSSTSYQAPPHLQPPLLTSIRTGQENYTPLVGAARHTMATIDNSNRQVVAGRVIPNVNGNPYHDSLNNSNNNHNRRRHHHHQTIQSNRSLKKHNRLQLSSPTPPRQLGMNIVDDTTRESLVSSITGLGNDNMYNNNNDKNMSRKRRGSTNNNSSSGSNKKVFGYLFLIVLSTSILSGAYMAKQALDKIQQWEQLSQEDSLAYDMAYTESDVGYGSIVSSTYWKDELDKFDV